MPEGVIDGGWAYVIAAYSVTWTVLGGYIAYLLTRRTDGGDP